MKLRFELSDARRCEAEKREPIEQVLATVDVLAEGEREQGERGNFSNLVSQLSAFEVLRLT